MEIAKGFQAWGADWDASVKTGNVPAVITGAFARNWPHADSSVQEWKDHVICSTLASNNNYLRLAEMFALAFNSPQLSTYHDPELIQRIAAALDFYSVAQGSNGGYDDRNHGHCWVGAPMRREGTGCLEGYGHTGFSSAFLHAQKELMNTSVIDVLYDDDDNATTPNITRRQVQSVVSP